MPNVPWNKGRLTGQKRPLKPKDVWAIRVRLQLQHRARDLALFNLAIDSKLRGCDLVRLQVDDVCAGARVRDRALSFRKRRAGRCSSKLPSRPDPRSELGFPRSRPGMDDTFSRAASGRSRTSRPGSMRGSSMPGSKAPGSTAPPTARIRCGERRPPKSTRRRAICVRFSCCSGIRSSKARFVTSGSRSTTRSAFPSRLSCELRHMSQPCVWRGRDIPTRGPLPRSPTSANAARTCHSISAQQTARSGGQPTFAGTHPIAEDAPIPAIGAPPRRIGITGGGQNDLACSRRSVAAESSRRKRHPRSYFPSGRVPRSPNRLLPGRGAEKVCGALSNRIILRRFRHPASA